MNKDTKSIFKKWWFWIIILIFASIVLESSGEEQEGIVNVNPVEQIKLTGSVDNEVGSLTKVLRKKIFMDIVAGERLAQQKADELFPMSDTSSIKSNLDGNVDMFRELQSIDSNRIRKFYNIDEKTYSDIVYEGAQKWMQEFYEKEGFINDEK